MVQEINANGDNIQGKYGIVVSKYNDSITFRLLEGAIRTLTDAGVSEDDLVVVKVPGAWELPVTAQRLAKTDLVAVLCLGAVIKGETTHDQYINQQVSHSLGQLAIQYGKPVLFGLLTCNNMEQAIHRAGGNVGNKGEECAQAALEMVSVLRQIDES